MAMSVGEIVLYHCPNEPGVDRPAMVIKVIDPSTIDCVVFDWADALASAYETGHFLANISEGSALGQWQKKT